MTKRTWAPSDWLDEIPPTTGATPDAFIRKMDDGSFKLWPLDCPRPVEAPDERTWADLEEEDWPGPSDLAPGQVVEFMWHESYPSITVTVLNDGDYRAHSGVPKDANCFLLDGEFDTFANSLDELMTPQDDSIRPEPGEHEVDCYAWSDEIAFEFRIENGEGRFVEIGARQ